MKIKKLIYILLMLFILPTIPAGAEEYPYLPTYLKEEVIEAFGINWTDKTMLYEKVNIYGDLDAWMIGWFDNDEKIVTGITDLGDIIYYSRADFNPSPTESGVAISHSEGEEKAREFMEKMMPRTAIKLISSGAYEYRFSQTHNGIRILGRDAVVVVDKLTGEVIYYKGFGRTDSDFELMESLITPEYALENYYDEIGLELVYNTVFDDRARVKTIRPMYILNRSSFSAIDAQTGSVEKIVMHDYNYYYNDGYYDECYYYDNNIRPEEKIFVEDGSVSASSYDVSDLLNMRYLALGDGYSSKITPGKIYYYSGGDGAQNSLDVLRIDIVPMKYAVNVIEFAEKFDEGNIEWLTLKSCETPYVFARAYVEAGSGRLVDYETVRNRNYISKLRPYYIPGSVEKFIGEISGELTLKHYGTMGLGSNLHDVTYARYVDGVRVIGEGAKVVYDSSLRAITDYSLVVTDGNFMPVSVMQTPEQIKESVKTELALELFYVDRDGDTKFVIYDAVEPNVAFDPIAGTRIDRDNGNTSAFIAICGIDNEEYMLNGRKVIAAAPTVCAGKLYLPLDVTAMAMGYELTEKDGEITLSNGKNVLTLKLNDSNCEKSGIAVELDSPPLKISESVYISAGSLRELFGMFVSWDGESGKIKLIK